MLLFSLKQQESGAPPLPYSGVWVERRILRKLLLSYRLASDGTFGVVVVNGVPGEQLA